jgi:hypothetical protein
MVDQTDDPSNPRLPMPAELQAFSEPCSLLPRESRSDFEGIRQMMIDDIQPETNIEWLWTLDLIELSWEIVRYRSLKQRVLAEYRHSAIRAILLRLDGEGMPVERFQHLEFQVERIVAEWRTDANAAVEIEARLRRHGFDATAVNSEVLFTRKSFAMFDDLMHGAQNRRMVLLREINIRREFAKRATRSSDAVIDEKFERVSKASE